MYDAVADPYCYPGTTVLKNVPGLTRQADLDRFEAVATARRARFGAQDHILCAPTLKAWSNFGEWVMLA